MKYKILYYLVKLLTNIFQRIYYRIDYIGLKDVPRNKPVVLAPNHVNAFIDPVLIGMLVKQEVRFFARGDVFKGKIIKWILNELNMSPVYRIQEGYGELKKNDKTFEECKELLGNNKTILMFPEAICIQERRLRPLKKGLARIIFQTASSINFSKDILVVPIGLNYTNPKRFRSKVVIHFGKPVSVMEYKEAYNKDAVKTLNEFTKALEEKMKHQLLLIHNKQNDYLADMLEVMLQKKWIQNKFANPADLKQQYYAGKEIAEMINVLEKNDHELVSTLREETQVYNTKLKQAQLRDHLLDEEAIHKMNFASFLKELFIICLGYPVYAIALVLNYPPYFLAMQYSNKKVKNVEFYASICSTIAMFMWLLYYGLQLLIVGFVFRNWNVLCLYSISVPLLGYFALAYYPIKQKIKGRWRLLQMVKKDKSTVTELIQLRSVILQQINQVKKIIVRQP